MEGNEVVKRKSWEDAREFLQENGMKCPQGMKLVSLTEHNEVIEVNVDGLVKRFGDVDVYNCYGEIIGVVYKGEYFSLPETRNNINILQSFNINKAHFILELDDNKYPLDPIIRKDWMAILVRGSEERKEEFIEDCQKWAQTNSILTIPKKELENCLMIPEKGIRVKVVDDEYDEEELYTPIVSYLTPRSIEYVGAYSEYNGRVIFVNTDGKTYMSKGDHMVNLLKKLNFRPYAFFIPFRDNEVIINKDLRLLWEDIPEINDEKD